MKKIIALLVILALGAAAVYYYYRYGKEPEKPTVVQASISRGDIVDAVKATGTLEALRTVQVGSQVSGTVQNLFGVDFNSIVKKDQIIAQIDPTLLKVQVQIQEANIQQRQADIEQQKVNLESDQTNLRRTRELNTKGLANQQQLEQAELQVKTREAQIETSKRQLLQTQAALDQARLNVEYTTIKSPVDGVVVERRVDVGQTVQSSMNVAQFFVIATDLRKLKLTAGVDEADIGRVQRGQTVEFIVDAYGQTKFIGEVEAVRLNATNQNNVVTYPVWITVENPELKLKPSMTANVSIIVSTAPSVLRVPNQALRFRPNNEIYRALGLEPPAAGAGRRLADETNNNGGGRNNQPPGAQPGAQPNATQPGATTTGGQPAASGNQPGAQGQQTARTDGRGGQSGDRQRGQDGQAGQSRPTGRGFGAQSGFAGLSPEQMEAMRQRFAAGGGGRGGGRGGEGGGNNRGGRGGQGGGRSSGPPANPPGVQQKPLDAEKIDDLFTPVPRREEPGTVWTYDPNDKVNGLKEHKLRLGVTDGQFSEILTGDLQVGQQIVTGVIIPNAQPRPGMQQGNPLMGPQRGNPGGMQPGGGGGRGGDGGGGRGGGGGGGRGGN
jgi:HlyD family secretion protein